MRVQDGHTEIYSVDAVMSASQHTYVPFSSFRHKGGMLRHGAPEYYYHTRVRRGPSGLHNTWLILGGEAFDEHTVPEDESLSLTLTGTNGQLPRRALQSTVSTHHCRRPILMTSLSAGKGMKRCRVCYSNRVKPRRECRRW